MARANATNRIACSLQSPRNVLRHFHRARNADRDLFFELLVHPIRQQPRRDDRIALAVHDLACARLNAWICRLHEGLGQTCRV